MLFAKDYLTINKQRPFSIKRTKRKSHQILTDNAHTFEKSRYNDFATNTTNRFIQKNSHENDPSILNNFHIDMDH